MHIASANVWYSCSSWSLFSSANESWVQWMIVNSASWSWIITTCSSLVSSLANKKKIEWHLIPPSSTLLLFPPRIAHKPSSTCEHIQNHVCHMQKCLNEFPPRIEDKWNSMTLISVHINFKYWQHKKTEIHVVNLVGRPEKTRHSDAVSSGRDSFRFRLKTHSGFGWWPIEHHSVTQTIVCSSLIHYKNMIYLDTTPFK